MVKMKLFVTYSTNEKNADLLPQTDVTILFSIWHHFNHFRYGLDKATEIFEDSLVKNQPYLFFESGEEELKKEYKLPFDKKASEWLWDYIIKPKRG